MERLLHLRGLIYRCQERVYRLWRIWSISERCVRPDPLLRPLNLIGKFAESEATCLRQTNVFVFMHNLDQCRNLCRAGGCDDTEFRKIDMQTCRIR